MKKREVVMRVSFTFGSVAAVTVTLYEGKTLNECLKMRAEDIDGYFDDNLRMYVKI